MKIDNQAGLVSTTLIALIAVSVALAAALGFGGWAFFSRQDYKNNSDKKALKAADERQAKTEAADGVKYAEAAKNPLKTHKGPDQFGGVTVVYPKTWSGYVDEAGTGSQPVDDYFHPDVVPSTGNRSTAYALRVQVVAQSYDRVLQSFKTDVSSGKLTSGVYFLPKLPSVVGTRLTGQIATKVQGSMVVLPMRNMTLKVWTESNDYMPDFEKIILPNMTFAP